jgi:hypothetical protein
MFNIPPFQPRPPMLLSTANLRPLRRHKIFPNHVRLPTTNAACARLRLSRKHVVKTIRQTQLLTLLQNQLETLSRQLSSLHVIHHAQLLELQALVPLATVQNDDLDDLSCPSSVPFVVRTLLLSPAFILPQSCPPCHSSSTLSYKPIRVHTFPPADR